MANLFFKEAFRYGIVSVVAFGVDLGTLLFLAHHMHYLVAAALAFLLGGLVAYVLSILFVFRHRRIKKRSFEAAAFVALGLVGLAINVAVVGVAVGQWSLPLAVGKLLAGCGTFACNFLLRRWALFSGAGAVG
jgi:putative flippase GtrA